MANRKRETEKEMKREGEGERGRRTPPTHFALKSKRSESKLKEITVERGEEMRIHAFAVITLAKTCLLRHPGEPF